jgi:hypothetical protein
MTRPRRPTEGRTIALTPGFGRRAIQAGAIALFVTILAYQLWLVLSFEGLTVFGGFDYRTYMAATTRWMNGGPFYEPYQVAGPYAVIAHEILYPPTMLLIFVPFTVLPAILWWVMPLGTIGAMVIWHRPSLWGWIAVLGCLTLPMPRGVSLSLEAIFNGNPGIWIAACVALATRWAWAASWAMLKPTLAPFALIGFRRRQWWLGAGVLLAASLLFLPLWPEYVTVARNARTESPVLYSLSNVPLLLIPLAAATFSKRRVG